MSHLFPARLQAMSVCGVPGTAHTCGESQQHRYKAGPTAASGRACAWAPRWRSGTQPASGARGVEKCTVAPLSSGLKPPCLCWSPLPSRPSLAASSAPCSALFCVYKSSSLACLPPPRTVLVPILKPPLRTHDLANTASPLWGRHLYGGSLRPSLSFSHPLDSRGAEEGDQPIQRVIRAGQAMSTSGFWAQLLCCPIPEPQGLQTHQRGAPGSWTEYNPRARWKLAPLHRCCRNKIEVCGAEPTRGQGLAWG